MSLDLKKQLITQLVESSRLLRNYIDHRAKGRGTTRAQWIVLFRLREQEGLSQVDLADVLELQPISLVRLLDRLVEHGLSSAGTIPGIAAPTGCFSRRAAVSWLMTSMVCATPLQPMCCRIFRWSIESSLETLREIKDRIKSFAEPPGNVAVK
jgi:MarR family transcriptional regulator for hemolysin